MKEHPILFSGEMVRAILDGRKTQTRRVITPRPVSWDSEPIYNTSARGWHFKGGEKYKYKCPYGIPGDRLWVRETWHEATPEPGFLVYRATYRWPQDFKWKPSIFMPREASRITIEVTDIRVERVQDISDEDVLAEGFRMDNTAIFSRGYQGAMQILWDSINAKRGFGWNANPWVWVVSFKVIK